MNTRDFLCLEVVPDQGLPVVFRQHKQISPEGKGTECSAGDGERPGEAGSKMAAVYGHGGCHFSCLLSDSALLNWGHIASMSPVLTLRYKPRSVPLLQGSAEDNHLGSRPCSALTCSRGQAAGLGDSRAAIPLGRFCLRTTSQSMRQLCQMFLLPRARVSWAHSWPRFPPQKGSCQLRGSAQANVLLDLEGW